ncbi:MAG: hypothetical protein ABWY63_14155 [Hyphomicrobiaceae bacterium]
MGWKDAPIVTDEPAWKKAPVEDEKRSAKDEKLAADVGTLLGPDNLKRERIKGQTEGRESSQGQATGLSLQQGTLRNFGDELGGYAAASGLPVWVPPVISGAGGAVKMALGDKEATKRYGETAERLRGFYEGAQEAHPVTTTVGEIGGGMAGPVGSSALGNVALSAADAAVAGVGAGEDASSRTTGGLVGGAAGGALSGAFGLGQRFLGSLYERFAPTAANVEKRAAHAVTGAIHEAAPTPAHMAQLDVARAAPTNQPTMLADIGAPTARLAQTAANASPEADRLIRAKTLPRFENQADRARTWWDTVTGGGSTLDTQEALRATARRENAPRYEKAYSKGQSIWDADLQDLTTSPTVRDAIKDVTRTSADEAALEGKRVAVRNPFQEVDGVLALPEGQTPTLEFWDKVQQNLRAAEERATKTSDTDARRIKALRGRLNEHLDATVPEFAEARSVARGFFQAEDALDAGRGFLNMPVRGGHDAERKAFNSMSASEKELFRHGVTETVRQRMAATTDNQEIGRMFNSPEMRDRLLLALGPERKAELEQYLKVERTMSVVKNMLGQTTTARQLSDMQRAGIGFGGGAGGAAALGYATDENTITNPGAAGATGALVSFLKGRVDERVAVRMAQMLTSDNPEVLRNGIKILQKNKVLQGVWDDISQRIAASAGQQAGQQAGAP